MTLLEGLFVRGTDPDAFVRPFEFSRLARWRASGDGINGDSLAGMTLSENDDPSGVLHSGQVLESRIRHFLFLFSLH